MSEGGFTEGKSHRRKGHKKELYSVENKPNYETIIKIQHEILYLRQEVEFLKNYFSQKYYEVRSALIGKAVLTDEMKPIVADLLDKKTRISEADKAPKIVVLNQFIEQSLEYYKAYIDGLKDDRKEDWNLLEDAFADTIGL